MLGGQLPDEFGDFAALVLDDVVGEPALKVDDGKAEVGETALKGNIERFVLRETSPARVKLG